MGLFGCIKAMHMLIYGFSFTLVIAVAKAISLPDVTPWSPLQLVQAPICIKSYPDGTSTTQTYKARPGSAWEGLETCNRQACIFSNRELGGGIVLVTSPKNAEIVSDFPNPPEPPLAPQPFYQAMVSGKGVGLIANRTIYRGETIMVRPATMIVQTDAHVRLDPEPRDMLYDRAVARLPDPKRDLFMGQMGKDIFNKIEINCFQVLLDNKDEGDAKAGSHLGCYPEISRFNHDCRPK